MSAITPKADVIGYGAGCPLLTQSGHLGPSLKTPVRVDQDGGGAANAAVENLLATLITFMHPPFLLPVQFHCRLIVSTENRRKQPYNDVIKQNEWVYSLHLVVLIFINEAAHLARKKSWGAWVSLLSASCRYPRQGNNREAQTKKKILN